MLFFFFIVILVSATTGILIGWFSKCGSAALTIRCLISSVIINALFDLFMEGLPSSLSPAYILSAIPYLLLPFIFLFFVPNLLGALFISRYKRSSKP